MSHNSAGRLPYDSIVPRASLLDDRATRPPLRTGWPLASSTLRPRDRPRGRCLHVSAPLERNSFSSCKRLCITGRGITGYTRAWVESRGAFFLLFHAQKACVCGVYVVVGTRGCRAHLILQRAHVLHLSFFLWMDIFPLASLDRREGRCGVVEKGCGAPSVRWIWLPSVRRWVYSIRGHVFANDPFFSSPKRNFVMDLLLLWDRRGRVFT